MITIQNISKSPITILTVHQGSFLINPGDICKINGDKLTKSMLIYQKKRLIKIEVNDVDVSNHIDEKFDFIDEVKSYKEESLNNEELENIEDFVSQDWFEKNILGISNNCETKQPEQSSSMEEVVDESEKEISEITDIEYLQKRLIEALTTNNTETTAKINEEEDGTLTEHEKKHIKKYYLNHGVKKVAQKLNRTVEEVSNYAFEIGILKNKK